MVLRARQDGRTGERGMVLRLARSRKAPRDLAMRARMVELSWAGETVPRIAYELCCGEKTVRRWLPRFNQSGLEGLEDLGGQGRRRRITERERSKVIGLVKSPPPGRLMVQPGGDLEASDESGPPEWTLDALAAVARQEGIRVSRSQVRRILLAEGVRWRRTRSWTRSKDPGFEGKGRGSSACTPARPSARRSSVPTSSGR
ncbi:helix-turn-helix domain-containing protein [Streptomyces albipurpureus]|uniref:Helix-turn-helix domain-containing protein n=1 Tax=Streptomyces albipurpureus TaxID=2897419 RepID=A0ABT0UEJ0_9ACTN|nr:helix-turn-helix domain-containing protein [Streptomyces sp. CWNU-1]MCM2386718.1 helix-turn-helix domain-containing protein [Streptomyces sp. CWNU-1]